MNISRPVILRLGEESIRAGAAHSSDTNHPKLLPLTADYADDADIGDIGAISEIRGQSAWAAFSEKYKSKVRLE